MKEVSASRRVRSIHKNLLAMSWALLCIFASGCALLGTSSSADSGSLENATRGDEGRMVAPMTQSVMELLFADEVDAILGPAGAIQTKIDGRNVYLISDPVNDRMRIIVPIALADKLDPRFFEIMLEANFHRTGDARYGTAEGVVYSAFMHPISSLSPELLKSSLAQVVSLANTFGTRFSSDVLAQPVSLGEE